VSIRNEGGEMASRRWSPIRLGQSSVKAARSFDCGSAQSSGQTNLPLAFAQDDGTLEENVSFFGNVEKNKPARDLTQL
jgi:hypothetical protein